MKVNIFVQARMSSVRFPGKVLAPVEGIPLVQYLINKIKNVRNKSEIVVLTSIETSDDPLVAFLKSINCPVFRGNLINVFERFREALVSYPCDYFVRLCADSPFINPSLMDLMIEKGIYGDYELISNVFSRKFPKGQSIEMIKSSVFKSISNDELTDKEEEHVFPYFYQNQSKYKCLFFELAKDLSHVNQCVDTVEDLKEIKVKKSKYNFSLSELCTIEP